MREPFIVRLTGNMYLERRFNGCIDILNKSSNSFSEDYAFSDLIENVISTTRESYEQHEGPFTLITFIARTGRDSAVFRAADIFSGGTFREITINFEKPGTVYRASRSPSADLLTYTNCCIRLVRDEPSTREAFETFDARHIEWMRDGKGPFVVTPRESAGAE